MGCKRLHNWMALLLVLQILASNSNLAYGKLLPNPRRQRTPRAHSHNDYHQESPLYSALQHGIASIEVDVFPRQNHLLVGHSVFELSPTRTIDTMYLSPLQRLLRTSPMKLPRHILLLVDFKGNPDQSLAMLDEALRPLKPFLSRVDSRGAWRRNRLTVLISGNRPRRLTSKDRYLFLDGRIVHSRQDQPTTPLLLEPLVSVSWQQVQLAQLRRNYSKSRSLPVLKEWANRVHAQGKHFRVWGAPNQEHVWQYLIQQGVDWINIDDHGRFAKFSQSRNVCR